MATRKKPSAGIGVFRVPTAQEKSQYIAYLVSEWENQAAAKEKAEGILPFVTISRQVGCKGFEVGLGLAQRLNEAYPSDIPWTTYDREIVKEISENLNMSQRLVEMLTERSHARISDYMDSYFKGRPTIDTVFKETVRVVHHLCEKGHAIIIGRAGCLIGGHSPQGFHVRLTAPFAWRADQIAQMHDLSREEAERRVQLLDSEREEHFKKFYGRDISDPEIYDLILNQEKIPPETLLDLILKAMEGKGLLKAGG